MNRTDAQKIAATILISIGLSGLHALEWPVQIPVPSRLFGQRAAGVIERGIVLARADTVRASGHGTLLITLEENKNMAGFPGTLGNAVFLSHDEDLLTVYGNLDSVDRIRERLTVDSGTILANAGDTGWGEPSSCTFQVIDRKQKNALNPLLLLPVLPDTRGPVIKNVVVVSATEQIYALGTTKSVRQGKYRIYADIPDTIDGAERELAPFRISVLVNGSEQTGIPFELLKEGPDGELFLAKAEYTWKALYKDPERMYLGELTLTRGRADISIIARDISGNERSVLFGLSIE